MNKERENELLVGAGFTEAQIAEMRAKWDIAENLVPVARAGGAVAWVTKNSLKAA